MKTRSHKEWQLRKLSNPNIAARYLNAALKESSEAFLKAVGKVAQAHTMTRVAEESGVKRETLYRSFSEEGNPTLGTLLSVLKVLRIDTLFVPSESEQNSQTMPIPSNLLDRLSSLKVGVASIGGSTNSTSQFGGNYQTLTSDLRKPPVHDYWQAAFGCESNDVAQIGA